MAREGHTLTRTMGFEPRQHELLGLDLGDGPPRRALLWGALVFLVWWGFLWLLTGGPTSQTSLVWLLPPALLAVYGWRDGRTARRRRVTEWVLTIRWLRRGHTPVISLGRHTPTRSEHVGWWDRIGHRFGHDDPLAVLLPWRADPANLSGNRPNLSAPAGAAVSSSTRAQLISTDEAQRLRDAVLARTTRRPRLPARGQAATRSSTRPETRHDVLDVSDSSPEGTPRLVEHASTAGTRGTRDSSSEGMSV